MKSIRLMSAWSFVLHVKMILTLCCQVNDFYQCKRCFKVCHFKAECHPNLGQTKRYIMCEDCQIELVDKQADDAESPRGPRHRALTPAA